MKFASFAKKFAIVFFIIASIGAFPLAKKLSTTVTIREGLYSNYVDKETNKAEYIGVLIATWASSGMVCALLYGLGEITEYLHWIDKKLYDQNNKMSIPERAK